jgi:hypothetical protein
MVDMDKLDLLAPQVGKVSLQVASQRSETNVAADSGKGTQRELKVGTENQRAASDSVEISAEALELLRTLRSDS